MNNSDLARSASVPPPDSVPPAAVPAPGRQKYEPPQLVLVGNLRNLLGKSGLRGDWPNRSRKP